MTSYMYSPNIEALASAGTILHDAHAQPLCAPSRAPLLAGRHPYGHKWGFSDGSSVKASEASLAKALQSAGYKTAVFGKYGIGADLLNNDFMNEKVQNGPGWLGFDYSFISAAGIQPGPFGRGPYCFFENDILATNDLDQEDSPVRWQRGVSI